MKTESSTTYVCKHETLLEGSLTSCPWSKATVIGPLVGPMTSCAPFFFNFYECLCVMGRGII